MRANSVGATLQLVVLSVVITLVVIWSMGCLPSQQPSGSGTQPPSDAPGDAAVPQNWSAATIASGLDFPVKLDIAPDGTIFFNELQNGRIRVIKDGSLLAEPFAEIDVVRLAETGLIGIVLHPDYPDTPWVYVYATQQVNENKVNRVIRFTDINGHGGKRQVVLDNIQSNYIHNGGELEFGPDGKLYIATGDSAEQDLAQLRSSANGKILRINPDGSIPSDNPFAGSAVHSLGHRNIVGLAFHPVTKNLYNTENGPDKNDEINLVRQGGNYGWPLVSGKSNSSRFINPLIVYTPNIAPTGATFISSKAVYGSRRVNRMVFGAYNTGDLHLLRFDNDGTRVLTDSVILTEPGGIFDVTESTDGNIFYTTASSIKRLTLK